MIKEVKTFADFERLRRQSAQGLVFLLKHSLTCPTSAKALSEYELFSEKNNFPCFVIKIQEARSLSNRIEQFTNIKHESPQVLVFRNGKVIWSKTHANITKRSLEEFLSNADI